MELTIWRLFAGSESFNFNSTSYLIRLWVERGAARVRLERFRTPR